MQAVFVGGMIVGDYIQTHGNGEGGDYASIGTEPDCCHGISIVPQHMGMALKPPVKMLMFWSIDAVCFFSYLIHSAAAWGQLHPIKQKVNGPLS